MKKQQKKDALNKKNVEKLLKKDIVETPTKKRATKSKKSSDTDSSKQKKKLKLNNVKEQKVGVKKHKVTRETKKKSDKKTVLEKNVVLQTQVLSQKDIPEPVSKDLESKPVVQKQELPKTEVKEKQKIKIDFGTGLSAQEISEIIKHPVSEIVTTLMRLGSIVSATQKIVDVDTVEILLSELGFEAEIIKYNQEIKDLKEEEKKVKPIDVSKTKERVVPEVEGKIFVKKIPVVTIMGHVDHGKTTLLDTIRRSNLVEKEYGFITQHIGAYKVKTAHGDITFIDTPGHEAFSSLRSRGTSVTDIVVLVVSGDEGVMPQTIESINHAKLAKVAIIVAVNKMDLAGFNLQKVKQQLSDYGIVSTDWGGQVEFIEISARNNINIDKILDAILLQAEIMDLKSPIDVPAEGTIIETKLDPKRGNTATVIILKGKLKLGDSFVVGVTYGKVKAIISDTGERLTELNPGEPGEIMGFVSLPQPGDILICVKDEREAKKYAELEQAKVKKSSIEQRRKLSFEDIVSGKSKILSLVIKTDTQGSLEAIKKMLDGISKETKDNSDVELRIIHTGVGEIKETDVLLSSAGNSIIIGFNIRPTTQAIKVAKHEGVEIKTYRTVYELTDDIKNILKGMEVKKEREEFLGRALVKKVFNITKFGKVAGCVVEDGKIVRNAKVRVLRDNIIIAETKISSLKRFKEDVKEVEKGYECGIGLENLNDIKENDVVESYQMVKDI